MIQDVVSNEVSPVSINTTPTLIDTNADNEEYMLRQFGDNCKDTLDTAKLDGSYEFYISLLEKNMKKRKIHNYHPLILTYMKWNY